MTLFLIIYYLLLSFSLYKVFEKAGQPGWKALVPGLNFVTWCELIGRKPLYALWLVVPIVNLFILVGMIIDLIRSFGHHRFWQWLVASIGAPIYFFWLGMNEDAYEGPVLPKERTYKAQMKAARTEGDITTINRLNREYPFGKSAMREWTEAIIFAVFAAAFIRMFLLEAYMIPTSSMEGSLMVGDFLFVSKVHYGIRTPQTIAMVPLLHNRVPILGGESYLKKPNIKADRLPALESIDRNEPVVFNFPEGDSVYVTPGRTWSVHDVRRNTDNPQITNAVRGKKLRVRPFDKKDHYIKRCIALPGDTLEIRDRQIFINGTAATNPTNIQFLYEVFSPNVPLNKSKLMEWNINLDDINAMRSGNRGFFHLNARQVEKFEAMGSDVVVRHVEMDHTAGKMFPNDPKNFRWTNDNFGPIYIPKKGETAVITPNNLALYKRIISVYEGNDLEVKNGRIFINGEQQTQYTFQQDYFWMMGDNRHNSEDSRVWGFVPQDHVVGKPLFIWFSLKNGKLSHGINFSRIFSSAKKM